MTDGHCPYHGDFRSDDGCPGCGDDEDDCFRCPTCKGRGTVNPLTAPKDFFCAGVADCPHCDGTGRF